MSDKTSLRKQRAGTVINTTSKKQESEVIRALGLVIETLSERYGVQFRHSVDWKLRDIVARLRSHFSDIQFHYFFDTSAIKPDGGILFMLDLEGQAYPVLISEVKNQGTNDLRLKEGLEKQAKGNAIERLGKNVIGLRTAFRTEAIFPFVCFGYGCDFAPDSSILDRIVTINMFGHLCKVNLHVEGPNGIFDRGSFFFREKKWTVKEMYTILLDVCDRSILYYFSKYGKARFVSAE
jgi:type II restriction enzyme